MSSQDQDRGPIRLFNIPINVAGICHTVSSGTTVNAVFVTFKFPKNVSGIVQAHAFKAGYTQLVNANSVVLQSVDGTYQYWKAAFNDADVGQARTYIIRVQGINDNGSVAADFTPDAVGGSTLCT